MKFKQTIILSAALTGVAFGAAAAAAHLTPHRLRTEHIENPTVIDTRAPRLSWVNTPSSSSLKNASQSAYRLVVASSPEKLDKGEFDVWDSGKRLSADSYLVSYEGAPLADGADYFWRVMVWDEKGNPSKWSETASWGMGFTDSARWKAGWIGAPWQGEDH